MVSMRSDKDALRKIGAASLIREAADCLENRGLSRGTIVLPTGEVDVLGGVAIAVGVARDRLVDEMDEMLFTIPERKQALFQATWEYLDAALQEDPAEWGDRNEQRVVVSRLKLIAEELEAG